MSTETVAYNGTALDLVETGLVTWSASDIALRLRPDMTWRAVRGSRQGIGDTPQAAVDALAAAEEKASRAMAARERLSKGQLFAREMCAYLHIGPRTRRHRDGKDLHEEIAEAVRRSAFEPGWHTPERQTVFHTAFNAWASYDAHILGYRVSGTVVCHVTGLSPWQLCQLFGEMIDAGITNVGQGERFFNELRTRVS